MRFPAKNMPAGPTFAEAERALETWSPAALDAVMCAVATDIIHHRRRGSLGPYAAYAAKYNSKWTAPDRKVFERRHDRAKVLLGKKRYDLFLDRFSVRFGADLYCAYPNVTDGRVYRICVMILYLLCVRQVAHVFDLSFVNARKVLDVVPVLRKGPKKE